MVFTEISIFPILIMIILVEKFIAAQIEKGWHTAIILTIETIIIAIICYFIINWQVLRLFILNNPAIAIFGAVAVNIFLGKWTGLRLVEYIRFKDVIKYVEFPEQSSKK